jgi:hypothetical protein
MASRRTGRGRKKKSALRSFTRKELTPVKAVAAVLNGEFVSLPATAVDGAQAIVEGVQKSAQGESSYEWQFAFDRLARQAPFVWQATFTTRYPPPPVALDDPSTWTHHVSLSYLRERKDWKAAAGVSFLASPSELGWLVAALAAVLNSRHRDRLRRCPICGLWFVDLTRNKSALRCSRKCTITWSHAQRRKRRKR